MTGLKKLTKQLKIDCFRGDKEDIVSRMYEASRLTNYELILEVGGDCPLVDAELIDVGLSHYEMTDADFTSNAFFAPFTYPVGYDFSLIKKEALSFIYENATLKSQRFQPFEFVVKNKEQFKTCHFSLGTSLNHWRWTVDFEEDLDFLRALFSRGYGINYTSSGSDIINAIHKLS